MSHACLLTKPPVMTDQHAMREGHQSCNEGGSSACNSKALRSHQSPHLVIREGGSLACNSKALRSHQSPHLVTKLPWPRAARVSDSVSRLYSTCGGKGGEGGGAVVSARMLRWARSGEQGQLHCEAVQAVKPSKLLSRPSCEAVQAVKPSKWHMRYSPEPQSSAIKRTQAYLP